MSGPEHLFNISAYDFDLERIGGGQGMEQLVSSHGLDGVEMLTGHFPAPVEFKDIVRGVHLPYAVDWYSGWKGLHVFDGMDETQVAFLCYGRDREDMVRTVRSMILNAVPLEPAYGVMHAASPNIDKVFSQDNGFTDHEVLTAFAELLNDAVSDMPGQRPPFKLALENLWWPGLRLLDRAEVRLLEEKLEFDDWGICLDTGHLMNALRDCRDEEAAVDSALKALDNIGDDAVDRICSMHLHMSLSADYQAESMASGESDEYRMADIKGKLNIAYPHFGRMDWHMPFQTAACAELVDRAAPAHITHEFITPCREQLMERLSAQLSHFPMR